MTTKEVGDALVALVKEGKDKEAVELYYADDAESVEPMGDNALTVGKEANLSKIDWWMGSHEFHSSTTDGPFVNGDSFAVIYKVDITDKASGKRSQMEEIGLYTVSEGKITRSVFYY